MPVVLRHNEKLELSLAEYTGSVSLAELEALAGFLADNPSFLRRDCLSLVLPGTDFRSVDLRALDAIFARYRTLYAPMSFQIVRRSAWLCQSAAAQAHVEYWLGDRDARESMSSTIRQFGTLAEAGDWLLLSDAELGEVERSEGFDEIARFNHAPASSRAVAR